MKGRPAARGRGQQAEARAASFLEGHGLRILARNYRTRLGEIDLVASDGPALVFVEVRARAGSGYGLPAETVDARKRARITRAAAHYLQAHARAKLPPCRFDVVSLSGPDGGTIEWLRAAFTAE